MPLQFPSSASIGQIYSSGSSPTYAFNGEAWDVQSAGIASVTSASFALSSTSASFATTASFATSTLSVASASFSVSSSLATSASALIGSQPTYIQAHNASGQSFPNVTTTTITGWTNNIVQNAAEWNPTTGIFTATKAGTYRVSAKLMFAIFTPSALNNEYNIGIVSTAQGTISTSYIFVDSLANVIRPLPEVSAIVTVTPGQTIRINVYNETGNSRVLFQNAQATTITIEELPTRIQR
jgi:hypothetical protein